VLVSAEVEHYFVSLVEINSRGSEVRGKGGICRSPARLFFWTRETLFVQNWKDPVPEHDMVTAQNTENSAFYCSHACDTYPPSRDYAASDASNSPSQINIEGAKLAMPNEPNRTSLCVQAAFRPTLHPAHHLILFITTKMTTTPPPLDFDHEKGFEIPTKHKEAIR
jgi:hypothetical protein